MSPASVASPQMGLGEATDGRGHQVSFAERVRKEGHLLSAAIGPITSAQQADTIIRSGASTTAAGRLRRR